MRKLVFGCVLMLCGVIGGTGWLLAHAMLVEPGAWSSLANIFPVVGFGGLDGVIVILFYAAAIMGMIIAFHGMREKRR